MIKQCALFIAVLLLCTGCTQSYYRPSLVWHEQASGSTASLRGLSVVDGRTAWASGSAGTVLRTTDGGDTWHSAQIPGYETSDFRDVHAFSSTDAVVLSAGSPAVVLKTEDGGHTWRRTYFNDHPGIFFDAMDFSNGREGMAFSDPVDNAFFVIRTDDGGDNWHRVPPAMLPDARDGEAGFAASGSCLTVVNRTVWFGTGGTAARVIHSPDGGISWTAAAVPLPAGKPSQGVFSVAFRSGLHGIAVGGDYADPEADLVTAVWTTDGGKTWSVPEHGPGGFKSCAAWIPASSPATCLAVGTSGSALTIDGGRTWTGLDTTGYHVAAFSPQGKTGWAAGSKGRIARIDIAP